MTKFLKTSIIVLTAFFIISSFVTVGFSQESNSSSNSDWKITVDGLVETPLSLTIAELTAMTQTSVQAELTCYGLPLTNGWWTGVTLWSVLEKAGINLDVQVEISFLANDGYVIEGFPMIEAQREDVILAYELNGEALPEIIRLVVPGANGNVWVKWITQITVSTASSQLSPIEPLFIAPPLSENPNVQAPAISQITLPKLNESDQKLQKDKPSSVQEEPREPPQETGQPTEQSEQTVQEVEKSVAPTDYSPVAIAVAAALVTSVAAGALLVKRRKAKHP